VSRIRALVKRHLPRFGRDMLIEIGRLSPQPGEDLFLHDYEAVKDPSTEPRLTLVIPSVAPEKVFGGLSTGIEIFLENRKTNRGKSSNTDRRNRTCERHIDCR
jgi:hypothetical protein